VDLIGRVRAHLPIEARVAGRRLHPNTRAEHRAVRDAMEVPTSLVPRRRRRGEVWAVGMMRDEADTARHVVEHLLSQDVDSVLVADNGSIDGTTDILHELAASHPVHVVNDTMVAYLQQQKTAELVALARRSGADWIVPFDADELWFAREWTVGGFVRRSSAPIVWADVHNVFPHPDDDQHEADPFLRLSNVDTGRGYSRKLAYRPNMFTRLEMGSVELVRRGRRAEGLAIAHYPWRSIEHMTRKLRQGRDAVLQTNMHIELAAHWREAGTWSDERLAAAWSDLEHCRPVDDLGWAPVGPYVRGIPGTWERWELPADVPAA
jgi:glycosyltransferase involved in cell wall biosynthesis